MCFVFSLFLAPAKGSNPLGGHSLTLFGSGALFGLILDLGLLKIIWRGDFSYLTPAGGYNSAGPILTIFLTLRGKANIYLT